MPFPAFPTTPGPDLPLTLGQKADVREARFGDGYRQEQGRDINHIDDTITLTWSNLTTAEVGPFVTFLLARKGYERFTYTLPMEGEGSKTWTCKQWDRQKVHHNLYTLSATFERRFDVA